jgi:hypothetical protein
VYAHATAQAEEAAAIERAKRSPIAQVPRRPLYPEQTPPPLAAGEAQPTSPMVARFAEASKAARTEPDTDDFDFGASYAPPDAGYGYGYGYGLTPAYGWGVGVDVWPGDYGWRRPWYRPFGYVDPWPHRHWGGSRYRSDYRLRAPSLGHSWHHSGHRDLGRSRGRTTIHAHH